MRLELRIGAVLALAAGGLATVPFSTPAGAAVVMVSSEAQLRAAATDPGELDILIVANITLSDCDAGNDGIELHPTVPPGDEVWDQNDFRT